MIDVLTFLGREIAEGHSDAARPLRLLAERLLRGNLTSGCQVVPWDREELAIVSDCQDVVLGQSPCIGI
jgi:hypothetical protein